MFPRFLLLAVAAGALGAVRIAAAQDRQGADPPGSSGPETPPLSERIPLPQWKVRFDAMAWYVAPGGELRLPSSGGGQEIALDVMDMDNPRLSPLAELDVRLGNWRFSFGGFSFQGETKASAPTEAGQIGDTAFTTGDQLRTHLDFQSFELTGGYRVWERGLSPSDIYAVVVGIDVIGGARVYDTSIDIDLVGGADSPSTHEFFADPIVGVRADFDFYKALSIDLRSTVGYFPGDHSSSSVDIAVTGVFRPIENVGVLFGYRQLLFDLNTGEGDSEFKFRGGMAGLYAGVELRF